MHIALVSSKGQSPTWSPSWQLISLHAASLRQIRQLKTTNNPTSDTQIYTSTPHSFHNLNNLSFCSFSINSLFANTFLKSRTTHPFFPSGRLIIHHFGFGFTPCTERFWGPSRKSKVQNILYVACFQIPVSVKHQETNKSNMTAKCALDERLSFIFNVKFTSGEMFLWSYINLLCTCIEHVVSYYDEGFPTSVSHTVIWFNSFIC